ncbi:OmpA family protein [Modicisalibacter tunisiensis]|uniref:OmpA/MotB family protein n=1 Tax=Modicisalibacter tunisiensis TaxID=390637 RepID=UPI001CCEF1BE|nr:OmpA family protein [Modicisalibacter tunisiensis]MBZ9537872.1 OmpA family protein [Modicisalibacter tunisiensis]
MGDGHDPLLPGQAKASGEDGESWLLSYLDVLTLLITLFVLLLTLTDPAAETASSSPAPLPGVAGPARATGTQPDLTGLLPRLDGVSVSRSDAGLNLRIQDHLLFASGQADLTAPGTGVLHRLLPLLERTRGTISVEGHTDDVPIHTRRFPSNWELSSARASAVLRYLQDQGIAADRLRAIGYADTRPLRPNDSRRDRAANRRVELVVHERHAGP